jgi:hypothetical protein
MHATPLATDASSMGSILSTVAQVIARGFRKVLDICIEFIQQLNLLAS